LRVTQPRILMVAGEASADAHGAQVLRALTAQYGPVQVFGVGGPKLRALGMDALFDAEDMSLAGLTEVLWALPRMVRCVWALVRAAKARKPDVAVLLDLPDFNLPLAKRLKKLGVPVVYYISPQVWAWRAGRVRHIRRWVDKMLVILPFEEAFYQSHQVPAEFVGHPLTEHLPDVDAEMGQQLARAHLGLREHQPGPVVALLPGSRCKEVSRHLPTMLRAVAHMRRTKHPALVALLPVASTIDRAWVQQMVRDAGAQVQLYDGDSQEVLTACDAAMVCSGTATLETALIGRPMVVVYRVSFVSYHILRRLIRVAHIALVNLIAQERLVPELVQGAMTPEALAEHTSSLMAPGPTRRRLMERLRALRALLGYKKPSVAVARAIMAFLPTRASHGDMSHGP
jgi:lipid-A-disaccharide synthase